MVNLDEQGFEIDATPQCGVGEDFEITPASCSAPVDQPDTEEMPTGLLGGTRERIWCSTYTFAMSTVNSGLTLPMHVRAAVKVANAAANAYLRMFGDR